MNEHKVSTVKVFVKQGGRFIEIIPTKSTDIEVVVKTIDEQKFLEKTQCSN